MPPARASTRSRACALWCGLLLAPGCRGAEAPPAAPAPLEARAPAAPIELPPAPEPAPPAPAPSPAPAPASQAPPAVQLPFNERVLALIATYPERGFGGYFWPAPGDGTTQDLRLGREVIARSGRGNHCVGMTFEIFWRALEACPGGASSAFTAASARRFRVRWYVPDEHGAGPAEALPDAGLGNTVPLDLALPGDFVQAWNTAGTFGHSMVFLGWDRAPDGRILRIRYWSSQPWTEGIGNSDMEIGGAGWDLAHLHIARAGCPDRPAK